VDLFAQPLVRAIFRSRELFLGASLMISAAPQVSSRPLNSIGWVVLAEVPDRQVVVGAVTKRWEPKFTFRGISRDAFASFTEPGFVKIAWTIRADPEGPIASICRTETRAIATDPLARAQFRR
jgi:hypothetical protein